MRPLFNCVILGVDTETTGLDTWTSRCIELAVGRWDGGKLLSVVSTAIDTDIQVPAEVTRINGLSTALLAGCPRLNAVLTAENGTLHGGHAWMAHHAEFDREILLIDGVRQRCDPRVLQRFVTEPWLDTRLLARALDDAPAGAHGYSLGDLCRRLGIHTGQMHRAEEDVRAMFEVWERMRPHLPNTLSAVLAFQAAYVAKGRGSR